jgi:hypothetical protein
MPYGQAMTKLVDALEAWHKKDEQMVRWRHFLEDGFKRETQSTYGIFNKLMKKSESKYAEQ